MMLSVLRPDYTGVLRPQIVLHGQDEETCYRAAWFFYAECGDISKLHLDGNMFDSLHDEHFTN